MAVDEFLWMDQKHSLDSESSNFDNTLSLARRGLQHIFLRRSAEGPLYPATGSEVASHGSKCLAIHNPYRAGGDLLIRHGLSSTHRYSRGSSLLSSVVKLGLHFGPAVHRSRRALRNNEGVTTQAEQDSLRYPLPSR